MKNADASRMARASAVLAVCAVPIALPACIVFAPALPPPLPQAAATPPDTGAALMKAIACGKAYAAATFSSESLASEIADAAVTACGGSIFTYSDAYARQNHHGDYDGVRAAAAHAVSEQVRSEALRVVVEARRPRPAQPGAAPPATQS